MIGFPGVPSGGDIGGGVGDLLDFERLTIIVDSLVSRGSRETRMSKVKAVDCLYSKTKSELRSYSN